MTLLMNPVLMFCVASPTEAELLEPPPSFEWRQPPSDSAELDAYYKEIILYADAAPDRCRSRLNRLNSVRKKEKDSAVDNSEALCLERITRASVESSGGFNSLEVLGIASGSVATGILVGVLVMFFASQ